MKRYLPIVFLVLAACQTPVPDSGAPRESGVGFGPYETDDPSAFGIESGPGVPPISTEAIEQEPTATTASLNNPDISDEQDFDAVSGRETIESDAARLQERRNEYRVVQPEPVGERPGSVGPNIVAYALSTSHPVGTQLHRRFGASGSQEDLMARCAAYVSPDAAQRDFLARGGPERDRRGLDPDGDGYACLWDPSPFRAASR